jgi:hypothetical protein
MKKMELIIQMKKEKIPIVTDKSNVTKKFLKIFRLKNGSNVNSHT